MLKIIYNRLIIYTINCVLAYYTLLSLHLVWYVVVYYKSNSVIIIIIKNDNFSMHNA